MERSDQNEAIQVNKDRLFQLMGDVAEGKYRKLARELGVGVAQLHRVLNGDSKAGPVFLGRLRKFCKENGLIFDEFLLDSEAAVS